VRRGNGTYTAQGTEVFKKINGVCDTARVRSFAVVFTLTGPLTLP